MLGLGGVESAAFFMPQSALENSLADLGKRSLRERWGAFPSGACREVLQHTGLEFQDLIPDLETWQNMAVYNDYRLELRGSLGDLLIGRVREEKCG